MARQFEAAENDAESVDLAEYWRVLWRRKWVLLLCGILGLLGGWVAAGEATGTSYTATSKVLVEPMANSLVNTGVAILDEQQVAASYHVAQVVRRNQQVATLPTDLLAALSVVGAQDSSVLTFTYTATDPEPARALAQGFAEAYLQVRGARDGASIERQMDSVQARLENLKQRLIAAQRNVTKAVPGSVRQRSAELRRDLLIRQVLPLRTRVDELATLDADPGSVIVPATEAVPSAESSSAVVGGGALAGLLIGVLVAFTRERRDDRLHDVVDVKRALPMLPVVALQEAHGHRFSGESGTENASAARSGAYGPLVARLLIAARGHTPYLLTVASPVDHSNSRFVAEDVATSLKRAGQRVRLDLTADSPSSDEARDWVDQQRLWPEVADGADVVVIVAPPVLAGPKALLLAAEAGGVVLVVTREVTLRTELSSAVEQVAAVGASVMGVVVVPPKPLSRRIGAATLANRWGTRTSSQESPQS